MLPRLLAAVFLLGTVVPPSLAQPQQPHHYFGQFFTPNTSGDRRVSVLCIRGGSCRFEMKSMYVRPETRQCFMTTVVWDDVSPTERGHRFHTPPQRQGTHATSTFSFAIRGPEVTGLREVYETAEFRGHEASSETFTYRPMSEREGGSGFDVAGCDELSLN